MFVALGVIAGLVLAQTWDWITRIKAEADIREQRLAQREKQEDFAALKRTMRREGYHYDPNKHVFYNEFGLFPVSEARRMCDDN